MLQGCLDKLSDLVRKNIYAIGGVGIAFAFIQVRDTAKLPSCVASVRQPDFVHPNLPIVEGNGKPCFRFLEQGANN